jgi:hypothetical protein
MKSEELNNFHLGWFVGNFEPSLFKNQHVEIAVKHFSKGETEPSHKQLVATELTVVISGSIRMNDKFFTDGEIVIIPPGEYADFEAIEDSSLVCVKFPSIPEDKVLL